MSSHGGTARAGRGTETATPPRFFTLIPADTRIDFVSLRGRMFLLSALMVIAGLVSVVARGGLTYGIDFSGGTLVQVKFPDSTPIADVRSALGRPELRSVAVQDVGQGGQEFQIRVQTDEGQSAPAAGEAIRTALKEKFGEGAYEILRVETVGPKVGRDLWRDATLAVLAATVMMGLYIAFRFDLRFGIGAAVALFHDVIITVGAMSMAKVELDLTTVAALLTVVGFSVNDTVIISDRIRENLRRMQRESLATIVNVSVNETLSRTIITNSTAVAVTAVLYAIGGPVIHGFAFTLLVGFIVGTYSSIYIASPIVLYLEGRKTRRR